MVKAFRMIIIRQNKIPDSMFTLSSPILAIVDVIESRRPSSLA